MLGVNSKVNNEIKGPPQFGLTRTHDQRRSEIVDESYGYDGGNNVYKFLKNESYSSGAVNKKSAKKSTRVAPQQIGFNETKAAYQSDWLGHEDSQSRVQHRPPRSAHPTSVYREMREKTISLFSVFEKRNHTVIEDMLFDHSATSIAASNKKNYKNSEFALNCNAVVDLNADSNTVKWSKNSASMNSISTTSLKNAHNAAHQQQQPHPIIVSLKSERRISARGQSSRTAFGRMAGFDESNGADFDSTLSGNDLAGFKLKNDSLATMLLPESKFNPGGIGGYLSTNRSGKSFINLNENLNQESWIEELSSGRNVAANRRPLVKEPTSVSIKMSYDQFFRRSNAATPHNYADLEALDPNFRLTRENTKRNMVNIF
jgi:hypothetical protein